MKLSVITINLNNASGLEKTLSSIKNQTYQDFEYILIDGASTDGSLELIKKHSPYINYWRSEKDSGIYNAMNKGTQQAKGEYLLFLNSGDCLFHPDTLAQAIPLLGNQDIIYGKLRYDRVDQVKDASYPAKLSFRYLYENYLPHPASFIKKDCLLSLGLYDEAYKICADWVFFMQAIFLHGATYKGIEPIISIYDTQGLSAQAEHQQTIHRERERLMRESFPLYAEDYKRLSSLEASLQAMESKKLFRLLGCLGLYKSPFEK